MSLGDMPRPTGRGASVDSENGNSHLVNFADEVLEHCDVCDALDKAPHVPIAGASTASVFNEKVQVDLPFSGGPIALQAVDMFPKYSLLPPVQSKNPHKVRDVFCGGWLGTCGPPKCFQMDEEGERKDEIRTDLRVEQRIRLRFQEVASRPCLLECRNGP